MGTIGKCAFFGTKCLKEDCTAFEYVTHRVWEYKDDPRYIHFEKKQMDLHGNPTDKNEWVAVGIPYCRVLGRELPMDMTKNEPESNPYPFDIAYGVRP